MPDDNSVSPDEGFALVGQANAAVLEKRLVQLAGTVGRDAASRSVLLATAESCTGGGIAYALTETAGSSAWFDCGFVTYSNHAKIALLGVDPALLQAHGAVSEPVVRAMAIGAIARSEAHWAVAVTGVAGPGGGSDDKPVGTVWFGWAQRVPNGSAQCLSRRQRFEADRSGVRLRTALYGLAVLARLMKRGVVD